MYKYALSMGNGRAYTPRQNEITPVRPTSVRNK
jgi:hypothetical protein